MYLLFFAVWLIFSGQITLEIVLFGLAVAAAVYAFVCRFMDWSFRKDLTVLRCVPLLAQYLGVLLREIVKANAATLRLILAPDLEPDPVLVRFQVDLRSRAALVLLANSITLTPGTITVELEGRELAVHCLDRSFSEGMAGGDFVKLLHRIEEVAL